METSNRKTLVENTSILLAYLAIIDPLEPADVIWGLGSNDLAVAKKAGMLFHEKMAPWILFSGGRGHRWQDLAKSEAETFRDEAVSHGAKASKVLVETQSTNTGENIAFSMPILEQAGITATSAILITIPPFQRRAEATLKKHKPEMRCINAPISWSDPSKCDTEKLLHRARLCLGEIRRLQAYPGQGFIAFDACSIPQEIKTASNALEALLAHFAQ